MRNISIIFFSVLIMGCAPRLGLIGYSGPVQPDPSMMIGALDQHLRNRNINYRDTYVLVTGGVLAEKYLYIIYDSMRCEIGDIYYDGRIVPREQMHECNEHISSLIDRDGNLIYIHDVEIFLLSYTKRK